MEFELILVVVLTGKSRRLIANWFQLCLFFCLQSCSDPSRKVKQDYFVFSVIIIVFDAGKYLLDVNT